jgi:hypothetical protein
VISGQCSECQRGEVNIAWVNYDSNCKSPNYVITIKFGLGLGIFTCLTYIEQNNYVPIDPILVPPFLHEALIVL